ncbi:MAG: T9SS type A sorting domain-containing protein [Bacteroidetes bacterium]|nr:T9SS type A sorting domain-containing protein [Bacteroidota bacterium]
MSNRIRQIIALSCLFATSTVYAQPAQEVFSNSAIWQDYGIPVNANTYPKFKGRLVNCNWSDIETAPNVWDWTVFDQDIKDHIADSMPVIFMVYTRMAAPNWLFTTGGVPKVTETSDNGNPVGYSPYYLDSNYNFYFKRMISQVRQHLNTLDAYTRSKIIGVQACFGSTGDQIAYKGNVPKKYAISDAQFDSLFKVYSLYYYNEYKNTKPKITMLSNPDNDDPTQQYWLLDNCPGGWTKCGTLAKGSQQNGELDKQAWLYDLLNKPSRGKYVKARSEIVGQQLYAGWWTKNQYKEMFAIMTYCIYWGLDWPNQTYGNIEDPGFDSSFRFFNKYSGQKVPGLASNAVCALKDALDASDGVRFPASTYGEVSQSNQARFNNIYKAYSNYGAKLEDISAVLGNEYLGLSAKGTNDVGWRLLPGNYERYLHQIDANTTSAGYWNVDDAHKTSMYGRFARGFDLAKGKDALYFDVDNAFLNNQPLNGQYPVTIDVTYYDNGTGSWQLFYDANSGADKPSLNITCTNTNMWKKASFVLTDARFANQSSRNSDFYIKNTGSANVIFSVVELSRKKPTTKRFATTLLTSFDTTCKNSTIDSKSFVINAASLDGTPVKVGPLSGYIFSKFSYGPYFSSISFSKYKDSSLNRTIFVKMVTDTEGDFNGKIPVSGGGLSKAYIDVNGSVLNTSPTLNADVTTISCYNKKDGIIDLKPSGGIGPFTYLWKRASRSGWSDTGEDLTDLNVDTFTVTVNSYKGCSVSKSFIMTQPEVLSIKSITQDSAIICKGSSTTVQVMAMGGTEPYYGTGTFVVPAGFKTYPVTDSRGCTTQSGYTVPQGLQASPNKPNGIEGPTSTTMKQVNMTYSVINPISYNTYVWTVPADAQIISGQNTPLVSVKWGSTTGSITVQAINSCGVSPVQSKVVKVTNNINAVTANLPGYIDNSVILMPNPVKDIASIRFIAEKTWIYRIKITDMSGKSLFTKKGTGLPGTNTIPINVQHLAPGTYLIVFSNEAGVQTTLKMIKD